MQLKKIINSTECLLFSFFKYLLLLSGKTIIVNWDFKIALSAYVRKL
jgi:hypothetical protein